MNKLLQTTLIAAILSTGAIASMEGTGALPKTIESGATVYVNKDISIGSEHPTTIDNYGSIDTEVTSEPYPKLMGSDTTINNHVGRSVKEETEEANATAIKTANPVTDVTLDKVYKIVDEGGGYVNENLQKENVEIVEVYDAEIKASDLATYTDKDILYLGAEGPDRTVRIRGNQEVGNPALKCNIGSEGAAESYALEIVERVDIQGDISNYKSGSITIKKEGEKDTSLFLMCDSNKKQEIHVPINIESGGIFMRPIGGCDIYSEINVNTNGSITFDEKATLKTGAILRLGDKSASSGS